MPQGVVLPSVSRAMMNVTEQLCLFSELWKGKEEEEEEVKEREAVRGADTSG